MRRLHRRSLIMLSAPAELQQRLLDPASLAWPDIDRVAQHSLNKTVASV